MKIISFVQEGHQMTPVEVEVSISTGLPKVFFTGMADNAIKESVTRLKTAFQAQNFKWPKNNQIIINLKPAYIKKISQGLDLAIAYAILLKTKQLPPLNISTPYYVYGEVTLDGHIEAPSDCFQIEEDFILTGTFKNKHPHFKNFFCAETLEDLKSPSVLAAEDLLSWIEKPKIPNIHFSKKASKVLSVVASGEHSLLLAGSPGCGKTTLAQHILYILSFPLEEEFKVAHKISSLFRKSPQKWRPFISPHHSTPPLSMIGGGYPPFMGEMSKAHSGILFLDEYLEFQQKVQEALREPVEKGEIFITRRGESVQFPARFLLVAATNLCPCGALIPNKGVSCSYSLRRCRSYLDRLSGPMMDRFEILCFSSDLEGPKEVHLEEVDQCVQKAYLFKQKRKQEKPNSFLKLEELENFVDPFVLKNLLPSTLTSYRRRIALLQVARTLADLEQREAIQQKDLEEANLLTIRPFEQLKQIH